jgi:hypothetical protein
MQRERVIVLMESIGSGSNDIFTMLSISTSPMDASLSQGYPSDDLTLQGAGSATAQQPFGASCDYRGRPQSAFTQQACLTMQRWSSSHAVGIFPSLSPSLSLGPALLPLLPNLALAIAVVIGSRRRRLTVCRLHTKATESISGYTW